MPMESLSCRKWTGHAAINDDVGSEFNDNVNKNAYTAYRRRQKKNDLDVAKEDEDGEFEESKTDWTRGQHRRR